MDAALGGMQNATTDNRPYPTELVCIDANGLIVGAAPEGTTAPAGSWRQLANELTTLEEMARQDAAAANGNQEFSPMGGTKEPICIVESTRRNMTLFERSDHVAVAATYSNPQQGSGGQQH